MFKPAFSYTVSELNRTRHDTQTVVEVPGLSLYISTELITVKSLEINEWLNNSDAIVLLLPLFQFVNVNF